MRRCLIALCLAAVVAWPRPAGAEDVATGGATVEDDTPTAFVGRSPGSSQPSSARPKCEYKQIDMTGQTVYDTDGTPIDHEEPGNWYIRRCFDAAGNETESRLAWIPSDPASLAQQARESLPLPSPDVHTSPDASGDQLVGVPTWLWVEGAWSTQSATAAVPGVSVTVTATPVSVVWTMGDGGRVVCNGPGTRYDTSKRADEQSSECSYTYTRSSARQPGGAYPVSVTLIWRVSWAASGVAGGGELGNVTRTTALRLRVAEAQALNR